MIIEAIQHYPWRGGRIQGTDVRIPSKAVPAANALQFIRRFLHLPLNRSDVAHAVGVSESYLTALFKERYNTNLTDYMLMERVIRADKLLIHTRFPVAEIGERCGFSSTTYFIRAYRKIRVQTPLKIRQLARKPSSSNWAADLFHVENCARLEPVSRGQAEGVSNLLLPTPRYPLLIANATQYPLEVARHSAPGEFRSSPAIGPMEMRLVWNPAPSAWRLSCQGQVLGHYIADRNTSQILVDDSSFPAQ